MEKNDKTIDELMKELPNEKREAIKTLFGSLPSDISLEEAKDAYFREKYGLGEDWGKDEK